MNSYVEGEEGESEVFGLSRTKNRAETSKTEVVERTELTIEDEIDDRVERAV